MIEVDLHKVASGLGFAFGCLIFALFLRWYVRRRFDPEEKKKKKK